MEIVGLRKNTVLVLLIVGVDGWDRMISLKKEKALDKSQEPSNTGGELINRNSGYLEGEPSRTAPQPEEPKAQPDFPTNVQLYFNIDKLVKSSYRLRGGYKYPEDTDIRTLNKYADALQRSAQQYLDRFANQKIIYAFNEDNQLNALSPVALCYPLDIYTLL